MTPNTPIIYPWTIIAAMSPSTGIGYQGQLPWRLPEELKWFKENTYGQTVVMGRKTWESIGSKPLPSRFNVIVSSTMDTKNLPDEVAVVKSIQELASINPFGKIFIIGGEQLYKATLPFCHEMLLTYIVKNYPADTFFPPFEAYFDEGEIVRSTPDFVIRRHLNKLIQTKNHSQ